MTQRVIIVLVGLFVLGFMVSGAFFNFAALTWTLAIMCTIDLRRV